MVSKKSFFGITAMVMLLACLLIPNKVTADTYVVNGYSITESNGMISVTDTDTGFTAYLDTDTGVLTDIDGTVSYVDINSDSDMMFSLNSPTLASSGFTPGVWNYVTTTRYNLGVIQSAQAGVLKLIALFPSPAKPYVNGLAWLFSMSALANKNVYVKVDQYYDPNQPSKIREVVTTYAGSYNNPISSTAYVRNIF